MTRSLVAALATGTTMRAAAMATVIAMAAFRALVPLMGRASASRLDRQLADHSGLVVAGHVAGELQGGRLGERPDDIRSLARLQKDAVRSEEHTSELQSLMRNSYAVSCL